MLPLTVVVMTAMLHSVRPVAQVPSTTCLHERGAEAPDQYDRRMHAVQAARVINSGESAYSANAGQGYYATIEQMVAVGAIEKAPSVPGFEIHLNVLDRSYWFEVVDKTDPCGFRFISNQNGVIFTAEPIR